MIPDKPIYCKAAIFTCTCCAYATTIYSDNEFFSFTSDLSCETCIGICMDYTSGSWIYRDDFEPKIYFQMQMADLPSGKIYCEKGLVIGQVHWTTLLVRCHTCNLDSMLFTEFVIGENILLFYENCVENNKPAMPMMPYIDERGHTIFIINGTGDKFSGS